MKNKICGFTLAEVLITLSIIGVVAALTIPTVVRNYQKTQTVTQLKKVYTSLNQAIQAAVVQHGNVSDWGISNELCNLDEHNHFMNSYIIPYIKITEKKFNYTTYPYFNATGPFSTNGCYWKGCMPDGTCIAIANPTHDVHIDLNGSKKPNAFGKDIFVLFYDIQNNRVDASRGWTGCSGRYCECNASGSDGSLEGCAHKIMKDGWQIKDDYPW